MTELISAGTSMCHGNFTYHATFTHETTGKLIHLSKYISKAALWEDVKAAGATTAQLKLMKEQMKKAPTKAMYGHR